MSYTKVEWKNYPNRTTPLSAENLNKMDRAIATNTTAIQNLEAYFNNGLSGKQDTITTNNKLSTDLIGGLAPVATGGSYKDLNNKPDGADIYYDNENTVAGSIKNVVDALIANKQNILDKGSEDIYVKTLRLGGGSATNIATGFTDEMSTEVRNTSLTTAGSVIGYVSGKNYATKTDVDNAISAAITGALTEEY